MSLCSVGGLVGVYVCVCRRVSRGICLCVCRRVSRGICLSVCVVDLEYIEGLLVTGQEWLVNLLKAFHLGNLAAFHDLRPFWEKQNDLLLKEGKLEEKIRLLCLMEVTHELVVQYISCDCVCV